MTNDYIASQIQPVKSLGYRDYLADTGGYASILGLIISVWVLISLKRIKNQFLFQARYPTLKKAIAAHSGAISEYLNSFPSSASELEVELEKCLSNLKNLQKKLPGSPKKKVQQLIGKINSIPKPFSESSKQDIRSVYVFLMGLETDLTNLTEDQKWRTD